MTKPNTNTIQTPDNWLKLELHEYCELFPEMSDEDYDRLADSVREHGFFESDPIVLIDVTPDAPNPTYEILDGRNRHTACIDAKTIPSFVEYTGDDPVGFVTGRNLDRRHLTTGQKAAIAAKLSDIEYGEQKHEDNTTQAEAAAKVQVGEASLRRYKFVEKHDPELAGEVAKGSVPLETARAAVKRKLEGEQKDAMQATTEPARTLGDKKREREAKKEEETLFRINHLASVYCDQNGIKDDSLRGHIAAAVLLGYREASDS